MKRFIAEMNGGDHINIPADRFDISQDGSALLVYKGGELVGYVDLGACLSAHLSEREGRK